MTSGNFLFNGVFSGSLLVHLLVFAVFFALPSSPSGEMVTIYHINVIEAPSRPRVRDLDVSTRVISELKLEAPSLRPEILSPEPEENAPSSLPGLPGTGAEPPEAPLPPITIPAAPALSSQPRPPAAPVTQPEPEARKTARAALPRPPSSAPPRPEPPKPPRLESALPRPPSSAPPKISELPRAAPSPEEQLRSKIARGEVRFEEPPPDSAEREREKSRAVGSVLSLRLFLNRVQEAVQEQFTFPGGFEQGLQVRIRLTIERDGKVSSAEIVTSSGNPQFDYAATLAWRRAKFPPFPSSIEEERITRIISFSP